MKRNTKHNSYLSLIILLILLVAMVFYGRRLYQVLINNDSSLPILSFLINGPKKEKIIYKPEKTIRILEGWTDRDINRYLVTQGIGSKNELLRLAGYPLVDYRRNKKLVPPEDFSKQFTFLQDKPKYYGLEGYLFPDTYRVYTDATVKDVIVKMLENFNRKLTPQLKQEIKRQGKTIYEIITMASIIEKEAPITANNDHDARVISGIFWNRLKIGQALQSDATLSYIFNDSKPLHRGKELEVNSPYNTYKYPGLPPGPISNPGISAIKAAIYPIKTDYNYFLTPKNSQQVIYSRTYSEHLKNKYKYLK